jgi:hypothetical protein
MLRKDERKGELKNWRKKLLPLPKRKLNLARRSQKSMRKKRMRLRISISDKRWS